MKRQIIPLALALTALAGAGALADGSSAAENASVFNVLVPTDIPLVIKADGTVVTADDTALEIVNHSAASVRVSEIWIESRAWTLAPYNIDFSQFKADSRRLAFRLTANADKRGEKNSAITVSAANRQRLADFDSDAWVIPSGGSLPITADAKATAVTTAIERAEQAANIIFTVGWDAQAVVQTPAPTAEPTPTPAPMPEPTPEPTPDPTPEPTPEPTPDPTPEPTPEPTTSAWEENEPGDGDAENTNTPET